MSRKASVRKVRLDHLLGVYAVGSGDWSWQDEYGKLIDRPWTQKLLARIRDEGIREPILLGTDGRVWDGHHRIIIAMHLGLDSVPVEFAGEDGVRDLWRRIDEVIAATAAEAEAALKVADRQFTKLKESSGKADAARIDAEAALSRAEETIEAVEDFVTRHYLDTQMGERVLAILSEYDK